MPSILNVNGKWRALIRRRGHPQQCRTFGTKAAAEAWARKVESEMDQGRTAPVSKRYTLAQVIRAYRRLREASRPIADTANEHYMLKAIEASIGHLVVADMRPDDLVSYAQGRAEDGAGPYTINMEVSKLGTVLRYGGAALKTAFPDVVGAARPTLTYLRLIGGGGKRERRPTEDELHRLLAYFEEHHGRRMADVLRFAAITAMRRGEIMALRWGDLNEETRMAQSLRKHPRKGKTLERVPMIGGAWELMQSQPRDDERIFPFGEGTVSKYFTNACRELKIPDLHFHDLRHEGTSAMFERGFQIHEVALVTGHRDWRNLKRYSQLSPEAIHDREKALTPPPDPAPAKRPRGKRQGAQQRPDSPRTSSPRPRKS